MLYYNEEDLKRQIFEYETEEARKKGLEEGRKEGIKEGREETLKETIKNMLENNLSDDLILNCLNIDEETLLNIKKELI